MKIKIFKNDTLTIAERIIISSKSFIQIRNITRVWYGRLDVNVPYIKLLIMLIISVGVYLGGKSSGVMYGNGISTMEGFGIFLIIVSFVVIGYYVYLLSHFTLNFELTSGEVYAFTSRERLFIEKSYYKVKELLEDNDKITKGYQVNFENCLITVLEGDNNVVDNTNIVGDKNIIGDSNIANIDDSNVTIGDNNITSNKVNREIEYNTIINELEELEKLLPKHDVEIAKEAIEYAKQENEEKLKETLSKLGDASFKIISTTGSLATVANFIATYIK